MAKIVRFHRPGGPEVLQIEDIRVADPQEGEVRIRVAAVGLNRAEAVYREGYYWMQPELPSLIGYEASGVVEKIGPGVVGFSVGDYVSSIPAFSMCKYGTYGEVAVLPAYALTSYPPNLSPIEGAAIWMQYLTAFGLVELGKMHTGDRVLITAASSSVGLAAIQLANAVGAIPIATTRNQHKEQALKKAGAAFVINTKESQWVKPHPRSNFRERHRSGIRRCGRSRSGKAYPGRSYGGHHLCLRRFIARRNAFPATGGYRE